jgi:hypothetical protein
MSVETDRELLELAAKAAGISIDKSEANGGGVGNNGFSITGDAMLDWHNNIRWNPLIYDGDALRLAIKLRIDIITRDSSRETWAQAPMQRTVLVPWEGNEYAATRRAIVRAAAAIGRAMP